MRDLARQHAAKAAELLAGISSTSRQLEEMPDERRLQLVAAGQMKRMNDDLRWTADLAIAHALASIALSLESREEAGDADRQ